MSEALDAAEAVQTHEFLRIVAVRLGEVSSGLSSASLAVRSPAMRADTARMIARHAVAARSAIELLPPPDGFVVHRVNDAGVEGFSVGWACSPVGLPPSDHPWDSRLDAVIDAWCGLSLTIERGEREP